MPRQGSPRSAGFVLGLALLSACKRTPPPPDRTEPWPAPAVASAQAPVVAPNGRVQYRVERGEARFELPAKSGSPSGRFAPLSGTLELDLSAIERSRAEIGVDLRSLSLDGESGDSDRRERALNWLGLGRELAPEQRDHLARASFVLEGVEGDGGSRLSELRRVRDEAGERRANVLVRGQLALLGVRAPSVVSLSIGFGDTDDAAEAPERLTLRTRKPLTLALATYGIEPKDAAGTLLARELKLLGADVGKQAKVSLDLELRRVNGASKPNNSRN
jgi:hypothetical protein